jgi:AraC-like DNA-binding protein
VPSTALYRHRDGILPGAVVSAVAYEASGLTPGAHRGLPSPYLTFIVSVDGPVRVSGSVADGDRFVAQRAESYDLVLAGLHPVASLVEQPEAQSGVQLALHPLAARALLGCRAAELLGPADHGRDVLGRVAEELHDRVATETEADARLDVVEGWLRSRAAAADRGRIRPELVRAWQLIARTGGRCRVEELAREVMLSPRQLRELMVTELGVSPKQLCRRFRFDAVIARLASGAGTLADVAAEVGYADQAHLSREFRQMAGCSPSRWLAEEGRNIADGGHRNRPG